MVAGVNSIDYALLVIAADDGIMPQTIEHFEILKLFGIKDGAIVLNKIDSKCFFASLNLLLLYF